MEIEISKTLFESGYSNGTITLSDLMANSIQKPKSNPIEYQDVIDLITKGTYKEPGLINGVKFERLIQQAIEYENNIGRYIYFKFDSDRLFRDIYPNGTIEFENFAYPTVFNTLNLFSKLYSYKSFKDMLNEKNRKSLYFFHEPSFYLRIKGIDEKELYENKNLLIATYTSIVLRNLSVYSEKRNLTMWLMEIDKSPSLDYVFVSDNSNKESDTLCILSELNVANIVSDRIRLKKYIQDQSDKVSLKGVILIPFGEYEYTDGIHIVPLSSLGE